MCFNPSASVGVSKVPAVSMLILFQGMLTEPGMVPRMTQSGVRESTIRRLWSPWAERCR